MYFFKQLWPTHLDYPVALCKHLDVINLQSCVLQRSPHSRNRRTDSVLLQTFITKNPHIRIGFCAHFHTYPCINYQPPRPGAPERMSAMPPQALGDDMDVPFISWVPRSVQLGTDAMAPPGALMLTPRAPSVLGPLEDQVYWFGGSFSLREYSATIMSGVTYAPTPKERGERE